jgi:hypothetical protein
MEYSKKNYGFAEEREANSGFGQFGLDTRISLYALLLEF